MPLVVPNPTVPTNGQALDATPLLANLNAVYQAIQNFDASQIQAGTLVASAFNANINPNTMTKETEFPFIYTGLIWSIVSGLSGTMTGGTQYINGIRVIVNSVGSNTFAASKDIYIDVDVNGNVTYNAVTNGAAAPSLTANSNRVAKIVTNATNITSIIQTGNDSLGNFIYNNTPNPIKLGSVSMPSGYASNSTVPVQITGMSLTVQIPAGRNVKLTLYCAGAYSTGATGDIDLSVWDGAVGSGTRLFDVHSSGLPISNPNTCSGIFPYTPGATTKTYNVGGQMNGGGGGTINLQTPTTLLVELD